MNSFISFVGIVLLASVVSAANEFDKDCTAALGKEIITDKPSMFLETCIITTFEVLNGDDEHFPKEVKAGAQKFFDELLKLREEQGLDNTEILKKVNQNE